MNKQQSGFTLIELIMVIVILGILSAFALPRFADLGGDAEKATIQAALGAVKSASAIAHSAALAQNKLAATGDTITMEGQVVNLAYGYPTAADICVAAGLSSSDYTCGSGTVTTSAQLKDDPCFTYTAAAASNSAPTISALLDMDADNGACN